MFRAACGRDCFDIDINSNSNSNSGLVGSVLLRVWRNGVDMQGTP
ncbi:hypothetical protein [Stenotrophomonas sp.]